MKHRLNQRLVLAAGVGSNSLNGEFHTDTARARRAGHPCSIRGSSVAQLYRSGSTRLFSGWTRRWQAGALLFWLLSAFGAGAQSNSASGSNSVTVVDFPGRALKTFLLARDRLRAEQTNANLAWQLGRAAFDWAEFATNDTQRAAIAREGITACRQSTARQPAVAAGHYYLAMNLGQLARTKFLGALPIVEEMETEFKSAAALDARFDYAGAERSLGLLYFDAPGWPTSVGSRSNARLHLERAVTLSPDYPDNRLCLLEVYLKWGDKAGIKRELLKLEELLPKARLVLTGEAWEANWADWNLRWKKIKEKTGAASPAKK